jgi:hypothetical protein
MNEEQIQRIIDYMEEKRAKGCTQEEARLSLQQIGILDENGELKPEHYYLPYALGLYPKS